MLVYELSGYKVHLNGAPEEPQWLLALNRWSGCRQLCVVRMLARQSSKISGLIYLESVEPGSLGHADSAASD